MRGFGSPYTNPQPPLSSNFQPFSLVFSAKFCANFSVILREINNGLLYFGDWRVGTLVFWRFGNPFNFAIGG